MNLAKKALLLSLFAAPLLLPQVSHAASCSGTVGHVQTVSLDATRYTLINYTAPEVPPPPGSPPVAGPGRFDPTPLLQTTVNVPASVSVVGGRLVPTVSCLVAHFSAEATAYDNGIVFQVLLDGVPMKGNSPSGPDSIANPAVFQATPIILNNDNVEVGRPHGQADMLSYTFFAPVTGGNHTVKVLFANCCSEFDGTSITDPVTGNVIVDFVQAATLTLESK